MSKSISKRNPKVFPLFILIGLLLLILGFLFEKRYLNCLSVEPVLCANSYRYVSPTKQFTFRYPKDYPLTFKTGEEMIKQYGFDDEYDEWINFSAEFYPNAGGERLGSVIVMKNTDVECVHEYANKIEADFNSLSGRYKGTPPKIEYVKIAGKDSVRVAASQQPSSFSLPSDEYVLFENEKLYKITFDFDDYYHKKPVEYYENSKKIILSTFTFN